ncbi:hypothetical protein [Streptomyces cinereospinus]|uniref:Uncharacterized protein n=1 Tax=Streptomyces cinereospinus TaxID=285561 RepID=A0ABV5MWM0_9ACTN
MAPAARVTGVTGRRRPVLPPTAPPSAAFFPEEPARGGGCTDGRVVGNDFSGNASGVTRSDTPPSGGRWRDNDL